MTAITPQNSTWEIFKRKNSIGVAIGHKEL